MNIKIHLLIITLFYLLLFLPGCFSKTKKPNTELIVDNQTSREVLTQKVNNFLPFMLLCGVGGGIFSVLWGHRFGIKIIAGTLATVCIVGAFIQFSNWFYLIGGLAGFLLLGYVFFIMRKAIIQNVTGVQKLKEKHPEMKEEINSTLSDEQKNQSTIDIIKTIKKKIK